MIHLHHEKIFISGLTDSEDKLTLPATSIFGTIG